MLHPGNWTFTMDFHDSFHHMEVLPQHQPFLGFMWKSCHYCFCVLLFGLSTSPWVFMRFVKAMVRHLQWTGIHAMVYMDDMIVMPLLKEAALLAWVTTLCTILSLGWQINWEKSQLQLNQSNEFLGMIVDMTSERCYHVSLAKAHALAHDIDWLVL